MNKQFEKRSIPAGDVICEKQLFNFVDKVEKVKVNEEEIERLLRHLPKLEWLEKEDIIKRVVSLEFNRLIDYYQQADDIFEAVESSGRRERALFRESRGERLPTARRVYPPVHQCRENGWLEPAILMDSLTNTSRKVPVGRIDLMKSFSFFEVPETVAGNVIRSFKGMYRRQEARGRVADDETPEAARKTKGQAGQTVEETVNAPSAFPVFT